MKLPTVVRPTAMRGVLKPLRDDLAPHAARAVRRRAGLAPVAAGGADAEPARLLGLVGGASLTLLVVNIGETVGGPFRRLALLAPRGRVFGTGPNDFQVNRTAASVGVTASRRIASWRLHAERPAHAVSLSPRSS